MNKYNTEIAVLALWTIIVLLLGSVAGYNICSCNRKIEVVTDTIVSVKHDTITTTKVFEKPKPIHVYKHTTNTVRDTVFVLQDYNTVKVYNRQLIKDSRADIAIIDTVFRNELQGYKLNAKLYTHDTTRIIERHVFQKPKPQFFAGVQTGFDFDKRYYIAPTAMYVSKSGKNGYSASYDPVNKIVLIGGYVKIF